MIDSPILNRVKPEINAFEKYFSQNTDYEGVVSFSNLGKDALLVVPCAWESIDIDTYTHLANFVRKAPQKQQHSLWQNLAYVLDNQLNNKPLWISTAGLGVYWLHIRIDTIPKYYRHQPYKLIN